MPRLSRPPSGQKDSATNKIVEQAMQGLNEA